MASLDYNHQQFISEFENKLRNEGFYLKKNFDDTPRGGRFYKEGYKNKAFGRYKYVDAAATTSGNPMIMWTLFSVVDKSGKVISSHQTNYFWFIAKDQEEKGRKQNRPKFNEAAYKKAVAERLENERQLQRELSLEAYKEYKNAKDETANPNNQAYLVRKNIQAGRGLIICKDDVRIGSYYNQFKAVEKDKDYFYLKKGDLIIPAMNLDLEFVTYQRITDQGVKLQRIDISTVGAFYCLGDWRTSTKRIYVCEGYATGYSLQAATGGVVFVCFDVHNVGVVLKVIKERFPKIEVIICTDNDRRKKTKVGLYKGFEYSYLTDSPFIFPVFPEGDKYADQSDWNDLAQSMDSSQMKKMCESQIDFFYKVGKNICIERVARKNGITGENLKDYAKNNEFLFKTMDLSFA